MPAPTITALPDAPSRLDEPLTFIAKADAFVEALALFRTDLNALASYLDLLANGAFKTYVRVATAAAGTLATGFENGDTVDGVVLATGDRFLLKDQAAPADNGIYTVNASGAPTRTTDADIGGEMVSALIAVSEGTVNADTLWICTTNAPITLGSTSLTFAQFTGGGMLGSNNLAELTNAVTARSNLGLAALAVLATINGSLWSGADLAVADGGTGASSASAARGNLGLVIGTDIAARSPSIQSVASSATVTPTFADDQVNITAQAAGLTLANPTGTAVDGWGVAIRIKDNGTARAISYGSQYRAMGVTLPTTTVISKTLYLGMVFNNADTKWDVVAVAQEA